MILHDIHNWKIIFYISHATQIYYYFLSEINQ